MEETWKDIEGYEGLYQVSTTGKVRSLNYRRSGESKLLKQDVSHRGYKRVYLAKDGKNKHHLVHRLVAMTFIPNPDDLPIVNHKDEDPSNNNVKNLEWCTHEYNLNYGTRNKRVGKKTKERMIGKKGKDAPRSKPILMYDKEGNFIRRFNCIADANEYFGKDRGCSSITMCLRGENKSAYGYIFTYADDTQDTIKNKINECQNEKGKYNKKPINMYTKDGEFVKRFDAIVDANEYLGKDRTCVGINNCLSGRRKTAYGYIFRYAEENN